MSNYYDKELRSLSKRTVFLGYTYTRSDKELQSSLEKLENKFRTYFNHI